MEENKGFFGKVEQYLYYGIIGIVSFIALVFLPMVGSSVGLVWDVPDTVVGWVVWVVTKLIVAGLNILIFHCFICQAKINIRDNKYYTDANDKLMTALNKKRKTPKSPKEFMKKEYTQKGITIFLITALSTIALTQAILTFKVATMLSYLFTIIMGIIFGIIEMKKVEEYWVSEYYDYAVWKIETIEEEKKLAEVKEQEKKAAKESEEVVADEVEQNFYEGEVYFISEESVKTEGDELC